MGYSTPYEAGTVGSTTERGPSYTIWADCPWSAIDDNPTLGIRFFDDFVNFPTHSADSNTTGYASYIDTGNTITQAATAGGVAVLATDTTDNDGPVLQLGGGTGGSFQITTATAGKLWFEARISCDTIADSAIFLGLAAPNATADNGLLVDDTGALATTLGSIGVIAPANGSSTLVFKAAHVKASGTSQYPVTGLKTLAADTWCKIGFKFDPTADTITWYVDGVANATTLDVSDAGSTDFPASVLLSPAIALKNGTGAARLLRIDWWRCAQLL